jgi:hypothetical protein
MDAVIPWAQLVRRDHHVHRAFTLDRHLVDAGLDLVL